MRRDRGKQERILKFKTKAEKFIQANKWKKALDIYLQIHELDSTNDRAMRRIGDCYFRLGDKFEAKESYKRLARLYAKNGFWAKAISTNKRVLELDPEDVEVQESIVELYSNMGIEKPTRKLGVEKPIEVDDAPKRDVVVDAQNFDQYSTCIDLSDSVEVETKKTVDTPASTNSVPKAPVDKAGADAAMQFLTATPMTDQLEPTEADIINLEEEVLQLREDVVVPVENVKVPLFSELQPDEFRELLTKISVRKVPEGTLICEEGQRGHSVYVIASGSAEVSVINEEGRKVIVAHLKSGEFFGEFGLLSDGKRHATVMAKTVIELIEFTKSDLREVAEKFPRVLQVLDTYYRNRVIDTILRQNKLFGELMKDERAKFLPKFELLKVKEDFYLFHEGDEGGDLYFIKSGAFEVSIKRDNDVIVIAHLSSGDFFGEIALLTGKKRTATIRCEEDGEVLLLRKEAALEILNANVDIKGKLESIVIERAEDAIAAFQSHQALKRDLALV